MYSSAVVEKGECISNFVSSNLTAWAKFDSLNSFIGTVTQLVECLIEVQKVTSSILVGPTNLYICSIAVNALACHARLRGFDFHQMCQF